MQIAGLTKFSLVDYPDRVSCVIFTQGCNFCCFYCHNKELIPEHADTDSLIKEEEILDFLGKRQGQLDALVITGGEPTLQKDLYSFIQKIKMSFPNLLIKLDTNGSNPALLKKLLHDRLIDYVAMDIKAALKQYEEVTLSPINPASIQESISLLINSTIDYEFRTTIPENAPQSLFSKSNIKEMFELVKSAKKYYFQGAGADNSMLPLHYHAEYPQMDLHFR